MTEVRCPVVKAFQSQKSPTLETLLKVFQGRLMTGTHNASDGTLMLVFHIGRPGQLESDLKRLEHMGLLPVITLSRDVNNPSDAFFDPKGDIDKRLRQNRNWGSED